MLRSEAFSALALALAAFPVAAAPGQIYRPLPAARPVSAPTNPMPAAAMGGFNAASGFSVPNTTPMGNFPGASSAGPASMGPGFNVPMNPFMQNPMNGMMSGFNTAPPNATLGGQLPTGGSSNNLPGSLPNVSGAPWANSGAAFGFNGLNNPYNPYLNNAGYGNPYANFPNSPYPNPYMNGGFNSYNDPRLNPYLYNPFIQNPMLMNPLLQPPGFGQ
jgi:hypothetical protein